MKIEARTLIHTYVVSMYMYMIALASKEQAGLNQTGLAERYQIKWERLYGLWGCNLPPEWNRVNFHAKCLVQIPKRALNKLGKIPTVPICSTGPEVWKAISSHAEILLYAFLQLYDELNTQSFTKILAIYEISENDLF